MSGLLGAPAMPAPGSALIGRPLGAVGTPTAPRLTNRLGARLKRRDQIRLGQVHPTTPKEFDGLGHEGY